MPDVIEWKSQTYGPHRMRYAGTLYLPLTLTEQGFSDFYKLHPARAKALSGASTLIVPHVPSGHEPVTCSASDPAQAPCLDVWVAIVEDNLDYAVDVGGIARPARLPIACSIKNLLLWRTQTAHIRLDELRSPSLPAAAALQPARIRP
jgi:hypothetical protein